MPTDSALAMLVRYPWPGNLRSLGNEVERALFMGGATTEIGPELLSQRIRDAHAAPASAARSVPRELTGTLREVVEQVESEVILAGLIRTHWNKSQLAKELGAERHEGVDMTEVLSYWDLPAGNPLAGTPHRPRSAQHSGPGRPILCRFSKETRGSRVSAGLPCGAPWSQSRGVHRRPCLGGRRSCRSRVSRRCTRHRGPGLVHRAGRT